MSPSCDAESRAVTLVGRVASGAAEAAAYFDRHRGLAIGLSVLAALLLIGGMEVLVSLAPDLTDRFAGLVLLSIPFATLWPDYLTAIRNQRGVDLLYPLNNVSMMLIPVVVWLGRRGPAA